MYSLVAYVSARQTEIPTPPKKPELPKVHPVKRYNLVTVSSELAKRQADINFSLKIKEITARNKAE